MVKQSLEVWSLIEGRGQVFFAYVQFAQSLVRCGFPKVCTLQGGATRLRNLGLLADVGT